MRSRELIVFLLVVLTVYSLVNFYVVRRGWQALVGFPKVRRIWLISMLFLLLSFPVGRLAVALGADSLAIFFTRLGSFYIAVWLHFFLFALLIDIVRLADALTGFLPASLSAGGPRTLSIVFWVVVGLSSATILGGVLNAARPRVVTLDIALEKPASGRTSITAALASDIHLGAMTGCGRLSRIVDMVNGLRPDLILLPGDIVDESVSPALEERMIEILRRLRAPLGVYSVLGNHEVYSGIDKNLEYLKRGGVRVLRDEVMLIAEAFYLVGRRDPSEAGREGRGDRRTPLRDILAAAAIDRSRPLILLDHQPLRLAQAAESGVDLQLSGHTHAGQLFPLDLINKAVWELNWGYLRKEKTQYYVSCGVGTWGPPVRTGSRPEVVLLRITFGNGSAQPGPETRGRP
jgi:predicted MPP superfamily phosphohydrolase